MGELRVFRIDDGEEHWYVAPDEATAKRVHAGLMEPDDPEDQWEVVEVPSDTEITVTFEDAGDLPKPLPAGAVVESGGDNWRHRCRATAAAWAATYTEAEQLCSSVW